MRIEQLKNDLRRKKTELETCKFELVKIDVHLHRTDRELAEATRELRRVMDLKPRSDYLERAEKLRLNVVQIQSKLSSDEKRSCIDNIKNLQREISNLEQEIQRAEREQERNNACSTSLCR